MLSLGLDGFTPLHIAAQFGNLKALKILLEVEGVSAWIRDLQGRTPLHIAAGKGHEEVCAFLRHRMANEGHGRQDPVGEHAPVDLAGSTPAGYASIVTKGSVIPLSSILISSPLISPLLYLPPSHISIPTLISTIYHISPLSHQSLYINLTTSTTTTTTTTTPQQ